MEKIVISNKVGYTYDPNCPVYEGANSRVYKGTDSRFSRFVAIKEVKLLHSKNDVEEEIIALAKFSSLLSQVPMIIDYFIDENRAFIIMQWVSGHSWKEVINLETPIKRKRKYYEDLCSIISIIHKNGFEHLDLKPENIIIGNDDRVHLLDFNLSLSAKSKGIGTNHYRAPELSENYRVLWNSRVGASDVFSLGVILYELVTNHLPIEGEDYVAEYDDTIWNEFNEARKYNPELNTELNDLITKCMLLNPKDRLKSAEQIVYKMRGIKRWY